LCIGASLIIFGLAPTTDAIFIIWNNNKDKEV